MDTNAIRTFLSERPGAIEFRMVEGTVYRIPHRDYIWFTPASGPMEGRLSRFGTSFYIHADGRTRLVNALLVEHVRSASDDAPKTGTAL